MIRWVADTSGTSGVMSCLLPMNLPYTMDTQQAADAVLDFAPRVVYPYHYRGQDISDFKRRVNQGNSNIEVRLEDWYPGSAES